MCDANDDNTDLLAHAENCQSHVHAWRQSNGVVFEASKESMHVLSRSDPEGPSLKMLGVRVDTKLLMGEEVDALMHECNWKVAQVLRSGRFFNGLELLFLYKQQILGVLEYRTAALYHAAGHGIAAT